jgi:glycosyltransferase involved in cell wall biosynthesis
MREFRPHIVHTHTAKAGFLGRVAARMAGVPRVVHTFHGHVLQGYFDPARTWMLRQMERWLAGRTDRIITVSERVRQELAQYGVAPLQKISTVPLGFDLAPFLESSSLRGTLRRELGVSNRALLAGIVGRIFPIKNHPLFLEAAARVAREIPEAEFVVVGDGPLREGLERRAAAADLKGRVHFLGWRKDLPAIYADLDLLVVSSDNEGTPVAAIEAMASGCVVVATRVGGLPDLIEHEVTGLLVPPRDADALAGAIVRALCDPALAQRVRDNALLAVRQRFDVRRLIKDMEALYEDLWIQPSPPSPDS